MKGHFIDFIKEESINILKFGLACMFIQELRYKKKNFDKFKKKNGGAESLANKFVFLAAGPLPVAILHLEQKTRKILKIYI